MSGVSNPVPANQLERILARIFVVSVTQGARNVLCFMFILCSDNRELTLGTYTPISQRRVSLSVAAAAISAGEKVDLKPEGSDAMGMGESWWSYLPTKYVNMEWYYANVHWWSHMTARGTSNTAVYYLSLSCQSFCEAQRRREGVASEECRRVR